MHDRPLSSQASRRRAGRWVFPLAGALLAAGLALALALGLAGCGQTGPLEPPPPAAETH